MGKGRLHGQVAWISGAASGMGEATARLFAAEGARVAVVDVQEEQGQWVADDIVHAGGEACFIAGDVGRESAVRDSMEKTAARFGTVQIIVNNAGIVHVGPLHECGEKEWDRVMDVNLKSIFFAVKHAMPHLRVNRRSYVVNIGSVSGFVGQAQTPAYIASKHAVIGLTRSIALDYAADGLRCNCICPGITDTPMLRYHLSTETDPDVALAKRLRRVPIGVALTPHQIAKAVLYLACEDSAGITGTSLVVDGGYTGAAEWEIPGPTRFMEE